MIQTRFKFLSGITRGQSCDFLLDVFQLAGVLIALSSSFSCSCKILGSCICESAFQRCFSILPAFEKFDAVFHFWLNCYRANLTNYDVCLFDKGKGLCWVAERCPIYVQMW